MKGQGRIATRGKSPLGEFGILESHFASSLLCLLSPTLILAISLSFSSFLPPSLPPTTITMLFSLPFLLLCLFLSLHSFLPPFLNSSIPPSLPSSPLLTLPRRKLKQFWGKKKQSMSKQIIMCFCVCDICQYIDHVFILCPQSNMQREPRLCVRVRGFPLCQDHMIQTRQSRYGCMGMGQRI